MYIMAPGHNSTAYFINASHQSMYQHVYPHIVATQWIGKKVAASYTLTTIEELLGRVVFYAVLFVLKVISSFQNLLSFMKSYQKFND
jgi:hypothetical protein